MTRRRDPTGTLNATSADEPIDYLKLLHRVNAAIRPIMLGKGSVEDARELVEAREEAEAAFA